MRHAPGGLLSERGGRGHFALSGGGYPDRPLAVRQCPRPYVRPSRRRVCVRAFVPLRICIRMRGTPRQQRRPSTGAGLSLCAFSPQLPSRWGNAMSGLGYGSHIGRGGASSLLVSHSGGPHVPFRAFARRVRSQIGPLGEAFAPCFLASERFIGIRIGHAISACARGACACRRGVSRQTHMGGLGARNLKPGEWTEIDSNREHGNIHCGG